MKLFRFLKPYWWQILAIIVLVYLQVITTLELPSYMAKIIDTGIMAKDMASIQANGVAMLTVSLLSGFCAVIVSLFASRVATGFARDLRQKVFSKIESFSILEFDEFSTASLITRTTNDIQQIQMVMVMVFRMVLMAPFMAVIALQKAINNAPSMSWIIALGTLLMLVMITGLFIIVMPRFKLIQKLVDRINLVTRENLTGIRVVRAFNKEKYEEARFDKVNHDITKLNLFVGRTMVMLHPVMTLIMNVSIVAVVWYGAHLISDGSIDIGNMMAFMQYAIYVIMSFLMISVIFILLPRAMVSAKRVSEVIYTKPSIISPLSPVKLSSKLKGKIEFKDVSFVYPGADSPVLDKINFSAEPGQTTAFIGSTGSGKSTVVNLIPRFYDVSSGQVLIDGVDIRDVGLEDLYKNIGYVPQKGVLFSGTVKDNIAYGNNKATLKQVAHFADIAQASGFIKNLKGKLSGKIAQGGSNVSGGQKQRLSIARALAINPKIYIFDDSFSALDLKTDRQLRKALLKETKDKTVLIVGQRITTIMDADKIIVLDKGKIVGQGTHNQLIKENGIYREIAHSQLSESELKSIRHKNMQGTVANNE